MSDEPVYEVEYVSAARTDIDGNHEYLVHWAGYAEDEDSWEIDSNLKGCDRLLTSFWAAVDDIYANSSKIYAKAPIVWCKAETKTFNRSIRSHSESSSENEILRPAYPSAYERKKLLLSYEKYKTKNVSEIEYLDTEQYKELVNDDIDSSSEPENLLTTDGEQRTKSNQPQEVIYPASQPDEMAISNSDFINLIVRIANPQLIEESFSDQISFIDNSNIIDYSGEKLALNKMPVQWSWSTKIYFAISATESFQASNVTLHNYSQDLLPDFLLTISELIPEKIYNSSQAMAILVNLTQRWDPVLIIYPMEQSNISEELMLFYLYLKATNSVESYNGATNGVIVENSKFFAFASDSIIGSYMQKSKLSVEAEDKYIGIFIFSSLIFHLPDDTSKKLYNLVPKHSGLLQLLPDFYRFMKNKTFCIWSYPVDPLPTRAGCAFSLESNQETLTLLDILKQSNARNEGYNEVNTQVVFIHLGALHTIGNLSQLVERRQLKLDISFILYGSSPHYAPHEWRMKEIYSIGGIATLTPSVFLENPAMAINSLLFVHRHPLWIAYISFSTIGLLEYLLQEGELEYGHCKIDAAKLKYTLSRIYLLAQEGQILLLDKVPPSNSHNIAKISEWIITQSKLQDTKQTQQMIAHHFKNHYGNMSGSQLFNKHMVEKELVYISHTMQIKGIFVERYRRYIIYKDSTEAFLLNNFLIGIEWHNIDECPW